VRGILNAFNQLRKTSRVGTLVLNQHQMLRSSAFQSQTSNLELFIGTAPSSAGTDDAARLARLIQG